MRLANSLLESSVLPSEELSHRVHLLHWIHGAAVGLILVDTVLLAVFAPETFSTFWVNGVLLVFILISFLMSHLKMVRAASLLICVPLWGLLTYYLLISGGVTSPAYGFVNIVIISAGILLGASGATVLGLLCVLTSVGLYWAGNNGWLTLMEATPTPARLFATQTAIFISLTILMSISGRNVYNALTRAWRGEREVAERNRQLRQEIVRREQAQQEQTRLAAILEATSDLVGIADKEGRVLYVNRAGRRLATRNPDVTVTQIVIADYYPPEIAQTILNDAIPYAIKNGTWSGETILRTAEGQEIPVSQVIIAHQNAEGNLEYLSTIMRDISEHRRAEQNRLELALQKERLESFKEFLATISHDLKTPMSVINTSLYLLERLDSPKQRQEKIASIAEQIALLEQYIQDLLTLTRLDRAHELTSTSLDLNRLLSLAQSRCALLAENKQLTLQLELDTDIPPILADEQELYHALVNLVENAIHYTPSGGAVSVKSYRRDDGVIAAVSDTGIGIPPEELPNIFERFYRSEGARQLRPSGTGLGLAIVKRIVDIHSGAIEVESMLGAGTTFRVLLPASRRENEVEAQTVSASSGVECSAK